MPWTFFRETFDAAPVGILIVNGEGSIVDANRHVLRLFGYSREELLNRPVELLVDADPNRHRLQREGYLSSPQVRPMGAGRDLYGRRRDDERLLVEVGLTPLKTDHGRFIIVTVVDITERKQTQTLLEATIAEKEVLLRELHHRAKNNLALIGSLLDFAAEDESPQRLRECRSRIDSIALVHERLHQAGTIARVELGAYLLSLSEQVTHAWSHPEQAARRVTVEAEELYLDLEQAVPCGLIVNELLTNAFKHAWRRDQPGTVVVRARTVDEAVVVEVHDDGVGQPPGVAPRGRLGLELNNALARQLRATLVTNFDAGTAVTVTFPQRRSHT